jgi:outer membrane lipoprotein-sorting protein
MKGILSVMFGAKLKLAFGISAAIILVGGTTMVVLRSHLAGDNLPPDAIIKRAQEKYASLTSYSDEGRTVATLSGTTIITTFKIRLARPNLYRIDWEQPVPPDDTQKGAVWSAGEGDFLRIGNGGAKRQTSQELAMASATGISSGAAATIPGTFFKLKWGDQLRGSVLSHKQQPAQKVGHVDCYVFTNDSKGLTRTLWIGKQDFLIHQFRTATSAEAMKTALTEVEKRTPEMSARLQTSEVQGMTSTETHWNIVVNQRFSNKDFIPQAAEDVK